MRVIVSVGKKQNNIYSKNYNTKKAYKPYISGEGLWEAVVAGKTNQMLIILYVHNARKDMGTRTSLGHNINRGAPIIKSYNNINVICIKHRVNDRRRRR
jgi:hypothetical protein